MTKGCCYLLQTDDNYVIHTMVTMLSVQKNTPPEVENRFFVINAMSEKKQEEMKEFAKRFSISLEFVACPDIINEMEKQNIPKWRGSYTAYAKLFVINHLKDVDRVLYLDSDIIATGDISGAFDLLDNSDCPVAMAEDMTISHTPYYVKHVMGTADATYYNVGLMLFDVKRWKERGCEQKLVEFVQTNKKPLRFFEQDMMNILFHDCTKPLSNVYNFYTPMIFYGPRTTAKMFGWSKEDRIAYESLMDKYLVGHCFVVLRKRPWHKNNKHPLGAEYAALYKEILHEDFVGKEIASGFKNTLQKVLYYTCKPLYILIHNFLYKKSFSPYIKGQ